MDRGLNKSEKYLAKKCDEIFFKIWSYPNLSTDKGCSSELCDLLIVFDQNIIIFSDKSDIKIDQKKPLKDIWNRFYRKIKKAAKQIKGAESWINNHPDRIYLDSRHTQKFELLPKSTYKVYRIIVIRPIYEICKIKYPESNPSLIINTGILGDDHIIKTEDKKEEDHKLCSIGILLEEKYIHVLDHCSFELLFSELDTISDFVNYLKQKEKLLSDGEILIADGEEEILANFMKKTNSNGDHFFKIPKDMDIIYFNEGEWMEFISSERYIKDKKLNGCSYLWDKIILHYQEYILNNTAISHNQIKLYERIIRRLAKEKRYYRREYSITIDDFFKEHSDKDMTRLVRLKSKVKSKSCCKFLSLQSIERLIYLSPYLWLRHLNFQCFYPLATR